MDKNLRETNFGECGGKSQEWQAKHIKPQPENGNRLDHRIYNGAESRRECGQRAYIFINRLLDEPHNNVIVISHGFFRTFLIMAWLKVPVENMDYGKFPADPGSVTLLSEDDVFNNRNLVYLNRMDFLTE